MSRGNLDEGRCEVFDDRDRPFDGQMRFYSGLPLPCDSDPMSPHSYVPPRSAPGARPTLPRHVLSELTLALRAEMREVLAAAGHSYARLAVLVGVASGDALHVRLYRDRPDPGLCQRVAAALGRPDLAERLAVRA